MNKSDYLKSFENAFSDELFDLEFVTKFLNASLAEGPDVFLAALEEVDAAWTSNPSAAPFANKQRQVSATPNSSLQSLWSWLESSGMSLNVVIQPRRAA